MQQEDIITCFRTFNTQSQLTPQVVLPSSWIHLVSDLSKNFCILNRVELINKTRMIHRRWSQCGILDGSLDWWFISLWSLDWNAFCGSSGCCCWFSRLSSVTVKFQQLGQIETWLLQHLHLKERTRDDKIPVNWTTVQKTYFADENVVQWINSVTWLLDVLSNGVRQQLIDDFLQIRGGNIANDDVCHLLADGLDLRGLSVTSLAMGWAVLGGESNAEHAQCVSISGLDVNMAFNQCLPFLHHRSASKHNASMSWGYVGWYKNTLPQFVCSKIHSVEVGENVASLNVFSDKLELAEGALGIVVVLQIGQWNFKHATFQTVRSDSCSLRTIDQGLANLTCGEHWRSLNIIPVLAGEGIDNLLFRTFFATFGQACKYHKEIVRY